MKPKKGQLWRSNKSDRPGKFEVLAVSHLRGKVKVKYKETKKTTEIQIQRFKTDYSLVK